jgi:hypothetical protein
MADVYGISQICVDCYRLIYRKKNNDFIGDRYGSLKRVVLSVCFRIDSKFVPLNDLVDELINESTYVVAFRYLCKKQGVEAIGKYFHIFISTAFNANEKVLVKLELKNLIIQFSDCFQQVRLQLLTVLKKVKINSDVQYNFLKQEAHKKGIIEIENNPWIEATLKILKDEDIGKLIDIFKSSNCSPFADQILIRLCRFNPEEYTKYLERFFEIEANLPFPYETEWMSKELVSILTLSRIVDDFTDIPLSLANQQKFLKLLCGSSLSPAKISISKEGGKEKILLYECESNYYDLNLDRDQGDLPLRENLLIRTALQIINSQEIEIGDFKEIKNFIAMVAS